ncbi:MAG: hypothetical protein OEN23_01795 [Paracoccaceae bacterium]|nr:hypothetical protein [Paracoccaceae bacterium]
MVDNWWLGGEASAWEVERIFRQDQRLIDLTQKFPQDRPRIVIEAGGDLDEGARTCDYLVAVMRDRVWIGAPYHQSVDCVALGRQGAREHRRRAPFVGNAIARDVDHPALARLRRRGADVGGMGERLADRGRKITPGAARFAHFGRERDHRRRIGQVPPVGHLALAVGARPMGHGDQQTAVELIDRRDQRGMLERIRQTVCLKPKLVAVDTA